ncbi:MAG: filamentous hemagglutinin N-terminal domain-containing protein, partial [Pseudomonadota bacterium]|nr:filamentous hemagglutinin N-terminal domain-containing protein [Pseudomonadota bacterium]
MNCIFRSIWNSRTGTFVAVSENNKGSGKQSSSGTGAAGSGAACCMKTLAISLMLAFGGSACAAPVGGVVKAGGAVISTGAAGTTIQQSTANVAINWQSFSIAAGETVRFVQPDSNSVALNRVIGSDPSSILGNLVANGKVFLVNPNGVLFGKGASVNVGALVASTLNITDADFMAGNYNFSGAGTGAVRNQGAIATNGDGGYIALLGGNVGNDGVISARLGTVALAAGRAITLDLAGDGLLNVTVNQGAVNALVQNGGMIAADGGHVLLTAQAAGSLLQSSVNNTGVIRAQTIENHNGTIKLMGAMQDGSVNVGGTLDASAPNGGNGGFIETSAANVHIASDAKVNTSARTGLGGSWLIDPQDFTIGGNATDNISGATLSALLVTNSVVISTLTGPDSSVPGTPPVTNLNTATPGNGDINVNQAVSWTASSSPTTLTLNAVRDVNVNQAITATNGNFATCCGRDINVNAAITTVNGSVLLSAGHDVNLKAALTTTDGNVTMCAANDVNIGAKITLTRGSVIPAQSLGLPLGLMLNAGYGGTGPGVAGGTVVFSPLAPRATVNGPNAPVTINYNPVSYTTPTDYLPNFILTLGSTLTQHMLVFAAGGDKTFDGTTTTTFSSLKGSPAGVTLVAGPGSAAAFDTAAVGVNKTVTFTGYTLAGANADKYALPVACCGPIVARTTANISAAVIVPPPVVVPPVVVPPVVVPPVVVPPVVVPPVVVPPVVVPPIVVPPVVVPPVVVPPVVVPPVIVPPVVVVPPPVVIVPPPV